MLFVITVEVNVAVFWFVSISFLAFTTLSTKMPILFSFDNDCGGVNTFVTVFFDVYVNTQLSLIVRVHLTVSHKESAIIVILIRITICRIII